VPLFRTDKFYTPELLRSHPDHVFIFGDNLQRRGKGGQAAIRDEINAMGLATKYAPGNHDLDYFTDRDFRRFSPDIINVLIAAQTDNVVIPFTTRVELGTGLSELPQRAPKLYGVLEQIFTKEIPEL
jgi:hypothetical protein